MNILKLTLEIFFCLAMCQYLCYNNHQNCVFDSTVIRHSWPKSDSVLHAGYIDDKRYFAYIKDCDINEYIGYVNYHYNEIDDIYECGILIESKYRSKGYAKDALRLLVREANKNGIKYLYDTFEKEREHTLELFLNLGFEIHKETKWKKDI